MPFDHDRSYYYRAKEDKHNVNDRKAGRFGGYMFNRSSCKSECIENSDVEGGSFCWTEERDSYPSVPDDRSEWKAPCREMTASGHNYNFGNYNFTKGYTTLYHWYEDIDVFAELVERSTTTESDFYDSDNNFFRKVAMGYASDRVQMYDNLTRLNDHPFIQKRQETCNDACESKIVHLVTSVGLLPDNNDGISGTCGGDQSAGPMPITKQVDTAFDYRPCAEHFESCQDYSLYSVDQTWEETPCLEHFQGCFYNRLNYDSWQAANEAGTQQCSSYHYDQYMATSGVVFFKKLNIQIMVITQKNQDPTLYVQHQNVPKLAQQILITLRQIYLLLSIPRTAKIFVGALNILKFLTQRTMIYASLEGQTLGTYLKTHPREYQEQA